jgi:hypothetical protein
MSTLTPSQVRPGAGHRIDGHASQPSGLPGTLASRPRGDGARLWLRRKAVAAWMNVLITAAAVVTICTAGFMASQHWPDPQTWGTGALKLFALWCLSFLPGWLYVRFLGMRAKALWNEYVLNLHRLAWDLPWYLPEPPVTSEYHAQWAQWAERPENHDSRRHADNIYQQKFEAYYGRQVPDAAIKGRQTRLPDETSGPSKQDYMVSSESLFPVFLATAVLAVGWAAVLWDTRFVTAPAGPWDVLKYGFLGSYAFVTSMLIRRFFQSDLRPSTYASAVLRIMLVLLIVAVLHQVIGGTAAVTQHAELAIAFVVGFFPLVGLQALQRVTSKALRTFVPPVTSDYPLDQLDGFNLWYEARLTEEGVEDMQNLTTMNLVDVILHTRVPVGRLVDWIDQAFLLIHLEPAERGELARLRHKEQGADDVTAGARSGTGPDAGPGAGSGAAGSGSWSGAGSGAEARVQLRRVGIRTATDLLKAFSAEQDLPGAALTQRCFTIPKHLRHLPLPEDQLRLLVAVLAAQPGLVPVWNWQRNGFRCAGPDRP